MSLSVGETVGPYRIVEQFGQGGMATVFRAYHAALDRYVAIKVLHPAFTTDSSFLARFQREARVVARLDHPNIVPIYDFAEHDGLPYLVMKFIAGETLKTRLARSYLSAAEVLRCVEAVGAALDFAHGQGVLHRDIKPSNILLAADPAPHAQRQRSAGRGGAIYLTDFGLARMVAAGESTLSTDALLGTPSYMSPEQARGDKALDAGTDIYSFGVVIYELVVGRVPFSADTPYAVIHDHIFTPLPPPRSFNPEVPAEVEAILIKALAKDRASRYGTISELVADLRRALQPAADGAGPALAFFAATTGAAAPDGLTPPSALAVAGAAAPTVAAARPAASEAPPVGPNPQPAVTPVPAAPSPYRLQWWQLALIGMVVLGGFILVSLAILGRDKRLATIATQTALAAVPPTAVLASATSTGASAFATSATQVAILAATAAPTATADAAQVHLAAAERAFVGGQTEAGLAELDQAVAVNPNDTTVLLRAGDLALAQKLAVDALRRYYGPGDKLELAEPDARAGGMESHAALAFYVAAADQSSAAFLAEALTAYPDAAVPLIAQQRYAIFFSNGQGAQAALNGLLKDSTPGALARLVLGDDYLARGQLLEASRQYTLVADVRPASGVVPNWIIREARCDLDAIKTQRTSAKLETTCVDLSLLLTGK